MWSLILALTAFVGSHFVLSHPLRQPLTNALGRRGFLGLYSLVALATLAWVVITYTRAPVVYLWTPPAFFYLLNNLLMLVALVLFLGALVQPNPTMLGVSGARTETLLLPDRPQGPVGVVAITRHPLMWGIGLWAISHALVNGDAATLFLCLGIGILALGGAAMQDHRKAARFGAEWQSFADSTTYVPFAGQFKGRLPWRTAWPGWLVVVGGVSLFIIVAYFHEALFGVKALGH